MGSDIAFLLGALFGASVAAVLALGLNRFTQAFAQLRLRAHNPKFDDTDRVNWLEQQHVVIRVASDESPQAYPLEHNPRACKTWPGGLRQMIDDQNRAAQQIKHT